MIRAAACSVAEYEARPFSVFFYLSGGKCKSPNLPSVGD